MEELIRHYGGAILAAIVFIALGALVVVLIGTDTSSVVGSAFSDLVSKLTGAVQ